MKNVLICCFSVIILLYGCERNEPFIEQLNPDGDVEATIPVPTDGLVAWYPLNAGDGRDSSINDNHGVSYHVLPASNRHGIYGRATRFNGENSYIEIPDQDYLSIPTTGALTMSVWMKVEVLDFPYLDAEYVYWMGKGVPGQQEYAFRIYNRDAVNSSRIVTDIFDVGGVLEAGSYIQEPIQIGEWVHFVVVYDYPSNEISMYKNGELKRVGFFITRVEVTPHNSTAPYRLGTKDLSSFFKGSLDDLRFYDRKLTDDEIYALYAE